MFTLWGGYFVTTKDQDKKQISKKINLVQKEQEKNAQQAGLFIVIILNFFFISSTLKDVNSINLKHLLYI